MQNNPFLGAWGLAGSRACLQHLQLSGVAEIACRHWPALEQETGGLPDLGRDRQIGMEQEMHFQEELEPSEANRFAEVQKPPAATWLVWESGICAAAL